MDWERSGPEERCWLPSRNIFLVPSLRTFSGLIRFLFSQQRVLSLRFDCSILCFCLLFVVLCAQIAPSYFLTLFSFSLHHVSAPDPGLSTRWLFKPNVPFSQMVPDVPRVLSEFCKFVSFVTLPKSFLWLVLFGISLCPDSGFWPFYRPVTIGLRTVVELWTVLSASGSFSTETVCVCYRCVCATYPPLVSLLCLFCLFKLYYILTCL